MKTIIPIFIIIVSILCFYTCNNNSPCYTYHRTTHMLASADKLIKNVRCLESISSKPASKYDTISYSELCLTMLFGIEHTGGHLDCGRDRITGLVKSIIVTSDNNYNQQYKKGDTLNNIIKMKFLDIARGGQHECLKHIQEFLDTKPICNQFTSLLFFEKPDSIRLHKFHIYYEESNGAVYQSDLLPVYIK